MPVSSEPDGALFLLLLFRGTTVTWNNWESFLLKSFWGRQREKLNLHGTYNLVYIQVLVRYPDSRNVKQIQVNIMTASQTSLESIQHICQCRFVLNVLTAKKTTQTNKQQYKQQFSLPLKDALNCTTYFKLPISWSTENTFCWQQASSFRLLATKYKNAENTRGFVCFVRIMW